MNWIFWGLAAAFATSIWGICLMSLPDAIKSDTNLKFLYIRCLLIIAGGISFITLLLPNIGFTNKIKDKFLKNIDYKLLLFSGFVLFAYQTLLIYAFSSGGGLAQVLINLNLVLVILFGTIFLKEKINNKIWISIVLFSLVVGYIVYERNNIKTTETYSIMPVYYSQVKPK